MATVGICLRDEVLRRRIGMALEGVLQCTVVFGVSDIGDVPLEVRWTGARIVLIEVTPDMDLLREACEGIRRESAETSIVLLCAPNSTGMCSDLFDVGVLGLASLREDSIGRIVEAVGAAIAGRVWIDDSLLANGADRASLLGLTRREKEILALITQGHGNREIAVVLGLSRYTIQNHVSSLYAKLGVTTRAQAIVHAYEMGFGTRDRTT